MLDAKIRPYIDPPLKAVAGRFYKWGIRADHMTWLGLLLGALAAFCLLYQAYIPALLFVVLNRLCDGLDGPLARCAPQGGSDHGAFLDIVFDFCIYAGLPFCMAAGINTASVWAATAFLLFGVVMSGISFLAYAIIAAKRGRETTAQGKKGFFYVAGLMEGTETVIFLMLICVLPQFYAGLAGAFGCLCILTAAGRIARAMQDFA